MEPDQEKLARLERKVEALEKWAATVAPIIKALQARPVPREDGLSGHAANIADIVNRATKLSGER